MADNEPDLHTLQHVKFGHEEQDVDVFAITKFGIGLTLTILVSVFLLWGLFNYFKSRVAEEFGPEPVVGVGTNARKMPPEPRLQSTPRVDLQAVRSAEEQILNSYAVVDGTKGVVRIPIERAIDILAQRGLPARTEAPAPAGSQYHPPRSGAAWVGGQASAAAPSEPTAGKAPLSQSEGTKK